MTKTKNCEFANRKHNTISCTVHGECTGITYDELDERQYYSTTDDCIFKQQFISLINKRLERSSQ